MSRPARVAVVGGGISGLATAWFLADAGHEPVVLEAAERLGGKVHTTDLAGQPFDVGADAFLARRPEVVELCSALGLGDELVAPATGQVWLWFDDGLKRLPTGTTLGLPGDLDALAATGVLSSVGLSAARAEAALPPPAIGADEDPPLRGVVAERYGEEVADRLVDPLVSGVYAGDIARLGLRSATPAIAAVVDEAAASRTTLTAVLRRRREQASPDPRPVFHTLRGGLGRLVDALAERVEVRTGVAVAALERDGDGWQVAGERYDAVVVALPPPMAAALLRPHAAEAADRLSAVRVASSVVVALAYPREVELPPGSGMLVPRTSGRVLKAATWSSQKWPHLADRDVTVLRVSAGRIDDPAPVALPRNRLLAATREELAMSLGIEQDPLDVVVAPWRDALPQFDSGHAQAMAAARADAESAGVAVAGATWEGVGLPNCVRSARLAADAVLARLGA